MIRVDGVRKRFGETRVLDGFDLTVEVRTVCGLPAIVWPVGIAVVFAALNVRRYRNLAR